MTEKYLNYFSTSLLNETLAADTSLTSVSGGVARVISEIGGSDTMRLVITGPSADSGRIEKEIILVTAGSGDSLTVTRAQEGTAARHFFAGATLDFQVTAAMLGSGGPGGGGTVDSAVAPLKLTGSAVDADYNAANKIAKLDASGFLAFAQVNGALAGASASINVNSQKITSLATPTAASDASTKAYVDALVSGLLVKGPVRLATAAALAANTYNNGTSGVGATLTANANGALTVDGVAVQIADRVLVKNESTSANNGIYTVTATGSAGAAYVLTRATDMNTAATFPGAYVLIEQGTANTNRGYMLPIDPDTAFTIGTTSQAWLQFTGVGDITAGNGISISGNTISVSTTLPDNYTFSAAGTAFSVTNNATISGIATLGSVSGAAGSGALSLGSWTGDTTLGTGAFTYAGASGKAAAFGTTAAGLTISTTTSGTLALTSAGAANITGAAASTFAFTGGAFLLQTTSQSLTLQTVTSGTLALTSAGAANISAAASSSISTSSGTYTLDAATGVNIGTSTATSVTLSRAGQSTATSGSFSVGQGFLRGTGSNGTISPTSLSTSQTDYNPTSFTLCAVIRQDCSTPVTINSLATRTDKTEIVFHNISSTATNTITFLHDDGSTGTASQRFLCPNNTSVVVQGNGTVFLKYDSGSSRWRVFGRT